MCIVWLQTLLQCQELILVGRQPCRAELARPPGLRLSKRDRGRSVQKRLKFIRQRGYLCRCRMLSEIVQRAFWRAMLQFEIFV